MLGLPEPPSRSPLLSLFFPRVLMRSASLLSSHHHDPLYFVSLNCTKSETYTSMPGRFMHTRVRDQASSRKLLEFNIPLHPYHLTEYTLQ